MADLGISVQAKGRRGFPGKWLFDELQTVKYYRQIRRRAIWVGAVLYSRSFDLFICIADLEFCIRGRDVW